MFNTKEMMSPFLEKLHKSLAGNYLHSDLQNFKILSEEIMHACLFSKVSGKMDKICITSKEENEFKKNMKTSSTDLEEKIFSVLDTLSEDQDKFYRKMYWKSVKTQPKKNHVAFYNTIKEVHSIENDS